MNAFIVFTDAGKKIGASIHASLSLLKKTTWVGVGGGGREGEVSYISTKYLFKTCNIFMDVFIGISSEIFSTSQNVISIFFIYFLTYFT